MAREQRRTGRTAQLGLNRHRSRYQGHREGVGGALARITGSLNRSTILLPVQVLCRCCQAPKILARDYLSIPGGSRNGNALAGNGMEILRGSALVSLVFGPSGSRVLRRGRRPTGSNQVAIPESRGE